MLESNRYSGLYNRPLQVLQFVFPLQTMWYSLEISSFIHLKIIHSNACDYLNIWKQQFSRVSWHGLKWGNEPPKLDRHTCWGQGGCSLPPQLWKLLAFLGKHSWFRQWHLREHINRNKKTKIMLLVWLPSLINNISSYTLLPFFTFNFF